MLKHAYKLPSWEESGEAVAGWGNTITGATKWVREQLGSLGQADHARVLVG
jgi:hypothetical protein